MRYLPLLVALIATAQAEHLLIEAESLRDPGGWSLDTQFLDSMGSPYLLAHGLGNPVKPASGETAFPKPGTWHAWVRTKDWVAKWKAPGQPGRFQVAVNGKPLPETLGTEGADWHWQSAGKVEIADRKATISLIDLTGFCGRCDAIFFSTDPAAVPPAGGDALAKWRNEMLGLPAQPAEAGKFDLVVTGGGYGGMGAAISAARMGLKVALIQNRPVLGGNGSSEVRVWAMGGIRRGLYPQLGEIVEEFVDRAKSSPGLEEEFGDAKKEAIVRAEKNITLFLNHHVTAVEMGDKQHIAAVIALDTRTSERRRFPAKFFVDGTGHGSLGALAGAELNIRLTEHLGMSNMWRWAATPQPQPFPEIPWGLDLEMEDFPYPQRFHAQWFWESGFNKHPIYELEDTRDWNFRAIYGAWNAMKNRGGKAEHLNAKLEWVAYIGGTRESRQLLGDVLLTRDDINDKKHFPDGTVPTTWSIDLHYPKEQYAKKTPQDPFISRDVHDRTVDKMHGYPVPYRTFYSKNIENLFMAGRCISVTHEALGTVRVMKTGGMIGEVVGKAAAICVKNDCTPRAVYERYFPELQELMRLPGAARRETVDAPTVLPVGYTPPEPPKDLQKAPVLPGLVVDDGGAKLTGKWQTGGDGGLIGFQGSGYRYRPAGEPASARYEFTIAQAGRYEVRLSYGTHENRATNASVTVESAAGSKQATINQRTAPPLPGGFVSLGMFDFAPGKPAAVTLDATPADGFVHADAVQLLPLPK